MESTETIDITPVGLTVPGGPERIKKAMEAFENTTGTVANLASAFLRKYDGEIREMLSNLEMPEGGWHDELNEVQCAIQERGEAQEELCRAVAGVKPR